MAGLGIRFDEHLDFAASVLSVGFLRFPKYIIFPKALTAFTGPWPLLQFRNNFLQTVGLLGRVISPRQDRYLYTGQHKHRINAYTDIHALSGIRTHDPSVRGS
jgi:hypothetical protein